MDYWIDWIYKNVWVLIYVYFKWVLEMCEYKFRYILFLFIIYVYLLKCINFYIIYFIIVDVF